MRTALNIQKIEINEKITLEKIDLEIDLQN